MCEKSYHKDAIQINETFTVPNLNEKTRGHRWIQWDSFTAQSMSLKS